MGGNYGLWGARNLSRLQWASFPITMHMQVDEPGMYMVNNEGKNKIKIKTWLDISRPGLAADFDLSHQEQFYDL